MQIRHKIDEFLFAIFPEIKEGAEEALIEAVKRCYTFGAYKAKVNIEDNW